MIALLRGELALRRSDHVVIVCAGVGYRAWAAKRRCTRI
jgi:Holliday junction resolvasome RuvABC DNA-binding subunit